jgi:hypothetical protein
MMKTPEQESEDMLRKRFEELGLGDTKKDDR